MTFAEKGNKMAGVLRDFPGLSVKIDGHVEYIVANISNVSMAVREAYIYTGKTFSDFTSLNFG
jgi:V-type H+-transporting ATPase subunit A